MNATGIEWCDFSAALLKYLDEDGRDVWACEKCSPGCRECYSEVMAARFKRGGPFTRQVMKTVTPYFCDKEAARILKSKKLAGKRVFVNDMTDTFGEWVPFEIIDKMFAVFALRPDVVFQILTKRPERMAEYANWNGGRWPEILAKVPFDADWDGAANAGWPLPNVWLGTSCEDQQRADDRIPHLLMCPAAIRFISAEPLLGPIDLSRWIGRWKCSGCGTCANGESRDKASSPDHICKGYCHDDKGCIGKSCPGCGRKHYWSWNGSESGLHWVIVGGESGPGARSCRIEWIRSIVAQCKAAGVACFVKQLGAKPVCQSEMDTALFRKTMHDSKGGDITDFPSDLRVREMPTTFAEATR